MKKYNAAFFGLFENTFKILQKHYGKETALCLFQEIMETGLSKAYGFAIQPGDPDQFVRLVGERDKNVGLRVKFPKITEEEIIYQFHDDPFPNLKDQVAPQELDATYMNFKVKYLLGKNWDYKTTKHLWHGDKYIEHVIVKIQGKQSDQ
ncbi:MAG: hypothetical protein A3F41_06770 [Coxiella sp. RIFCSPHIGHO2_12_FULL_44_14]|nr:MAG: hypothetical protein A3F41_06770 [Coxiella sp. RIFCSPHIGHO2_12_FULL_44_14]